MQKWLKNIKECFRDWTSDWDTKECDTVKEMMSFVTESLLIRIWVVYK